MDENQDKIVINELKPFANQVDDVLNGSDTTSSHLQVLSVTPPLLRMAGVPNLPILMTAHHVKTITQESGSDSANYHGLDVELVKRLPELISDPVMIMDSLTRNDSIVIVTQTVDKQNRPVIGAIRLNGVGRQNSKIISANILTSMYGKDNFQSFIERNIEQGSVLYVDKEKSQALSVNPGIQFPDVMTSLSFNTIIRKTNAFVNSGEQKNSETTEKSEVNMKSDTNNAAVQSARERVRQVRDGMVKTLLEYIEKNPTDWQSGWNNIAAGAPYNGKTNTAYKGLNALYLAVLGMQRGYKDKRWVTFNQANELGASVKKGEKSSPVVFFEFYDRATKKAFDRRTVKDMTDEEKAAYMKENVYAVLKYSSVFNAEQCHNFPEQTKSFDMTAEERANQNERIESIISNSGAPVLYDGGSRAYYSPGEDKIHLPVISAFDTMQDYYATALHEIAHSTGHESRLNRDMSGGFGSESYAKEELRAELACVFMQMEQGIQLNGKHITNHAAYLNSWLNAAKNDTSIFFKAAADAQKIADYVADNYLQAADSAVIEKENVVREQPERNPMADYLRAESEKRAEEISTVERLKTEGGQLQSDYFTLTRRGALIEGIIKAPQESFYGGHIAIINNNEQLEIDKPGGYILTSGGYSPKSGDYFDAAYGFSTYEEAREYCVEEYGIDVGESAAAQGLNQNIKEWYSRAYPNDSAGQDIHPNATFRDLQEEVNRSNSVSVYGMLGEDSVIRERAFTQLAELTGSTYQSIYSAFLGETAEDKLYNARAQARRLATETGEPYVTIEWSEHQSLNSYDVMPLSKADKKLAALDAQEDKNDGYYKTKLHIDFVFEGELNSYENSRFYIGVEGGGLVHHIDEFLKNETFLNANERQEAETALEYFKRHMEVSEYLASPEKLAELSEEEQGDVNEYVGRARAVLNETVPFRDYSNRMPSTLEEIKAARDAAHEAGLPFSSGPFDLEDDFNPYVFDGSMSVEDYNLMWENIEADERKVLGTICGNTPTTQSEVNLDWVALAGTVDINTVREIVERYGGEIKNGNVIISEAMRIRYGEMRERELLNEGDHEEKLTVEQARNAMLDAQELRLNYYAVRIENVPYTDPEDGYESEEPAQVIYTISQNGIVEPLRTITFDDDAFHYLPYTDFVSYEPVEYEELEEIAKKVREPIQAYKDALRAELEVGTERRRSDAYYEQRANDVLDEHYRTEYGFFQRNIENPKYLSGTLYADETWRGEKILSITQDENGRNIAIIARANGVYSVAEDYHTDDGRNWGAINTFANLKAAEAFRVKNFPTETEKLSADSYKNLSASKSPLGQEYARIKSEHTDSVVFYRVGDFYEVLGADAERVADKLELTLTGRTIGTAERIPMCGVPFHAIDQYADRLSEKGENVVIADGNNIKTLNGKQLPLENAKNGRRQDMPQIPTILESLKVQLERGEITIERAAEELHTAGLTNFIDIDYARKHLLDDTVSEGAPKNGQNKPVAAQERKREWLSIELPSESVGRQYGENTMIKMPKGEFSYYAFYVPTKMLKDVGGKTQLRVASDYTFRLNNDGRQVELTGQELSDSFAGKHLDKTYRRVAPSRKFAQGLANIEKNVPAELKEIPTWCCYRTKWNEEKGKKDKFIISPIDGKWTSSKEPGKWVTFDAALKYARENNCEGVSVLLDKQYGITCIDLDKCIEAETGKLNERASRLVETLSGTYIERSTSGNGLHIFVKDDILKNGTYNMTSVDKNKGDLEVYDDKRIMSLTGDMYSKGNTLTRAGSAATVYLRQELGERRSVANSGDKPRPAGSLNLSDNELIRWIQGSKQSSKFNDLYHGRGVSGNRSDDDAKLAHMLLYFNGGDKEQAFRIMRESGAYRPDKPDSYYRATIDKMNGKIEVYAKRPTFSADGRGKPKGKGLNGSNRA